MGICGRQGGAGRNKAPGPGARMSGRTGHYPGRGQGIHGCDSHLSGTDRTPDPAGSKDHFRHPHPAGAQRHALDHGG